jgi:hypothetical protein
VQATLGRSRNQEEGYRRTIAKEVPLEGGLIQAIAFDRIVPVVVKASVVEAQVVTILLESLEFCVAAAAAARFGSAREGLASVFGDEHQVIFIEFFAGGLAPFALLAAIFIRPVTASVSSLHSVCLAQTLLLKREVELLSVALAPALTLPSSDSPTSPFAGFLILHILHHESVVLIVVGLIFQIFFLAAVVEAQRLLIPRFFVKIRYNPPPPAREWPQNETGRTSLGALER